VRFAPQFLNWAIKDALCVFLMRDGGRRLHDEIVFTMNSVARSAFHIYIPTA